MVTGVNGVKSTNQAQTPKLDSKSESKSDLKAIKTLLALVFTLAATSNHNGTLATAGRYGTAAGQALILMNAQNGNNSPWINSGSHSDFAEKLVDDLAEALKTQTEEKKKPEPISLNERNTELKDLKAEKKAKKAQIKTEISDVAGDLGLKVKDAKSAAKKEKLKTREKSFTSALGELQKSRTEVRARLQKAQINGNKKEEKQARKDLELVKIQERIFHSVAPEDRSKKGVLEQTQSIAQRVQEQIATIEEAKEPAQKKSFFGLFSKPDTRTTESRQRAIADAKNLIGELRVEAGITSDKILSQIINSYIS